MLPTQYTVAQVAEYFHRDEKTIRRWITDGKFPHAYRIADGWFITEVDVKRLVKQMQGESAGEVPRSQKNTPVKKSSSKGFVSGWK